jgi:DNA-binding transcriptional ArsR family regulator
METLSALADPTRRRIVEMLAECDRTTGEIVTEFAMSAPAISQHLNVLRDARLVTTRVSGKHRIQSLDFRGIKEMEVWISRTKRIWESRLDALERELLTEAKNDQPKENP